MRVSHFNQHLKKLVNKRTKKLILKSSTSDSSIPINVYRKKKVFANLFKLNLACYASFAINKMAAL